MRICSRIHDGNFPKLKNLQKAIFNVLASLARLEVPAWFLRCGNSLPSTGHAFVQDLSVVSQRDEWPKITSPDSKRCYLDTDKILRR